MESKSETRGVKLIESICDDVFFETSDLLVVFYGCTGVPWRRGKRYFKKFSCKKIFRSRYNSKDEDMNEDAPYVVACLTKRKYFLFKKYMGDYLEDDIPCQMAFVSLKKGAAIQLHDSRGLDVVSEDIDFLKYLYRTYEKDIIEYNRRQIIEALQNTGGKMDRRSPEFQMFLKISFENDFDVNKITEALQMKPCLCVRYSESGYTKVTHIKQLGAWWYCYPSPTDFEKSWKIQEVLDTFFAPLDERKIEMLEKIVKENEGSVALTVNVYFEHEALPEMCFGGRAMRVLNRLNAEIEINMNEDNEEA